MSVAERTASIIWEGDLREGSGTVTLGSSAHAGCYAMAQSLTLTEAGNPP